MIDPQNFLDKLGNEVQTMSDSERLAFGSAVCERYLPEYKLFSAQHEWGDPPLFEQAIQLAVSQQTDKTDRRTDAEKLLEGCVEATPDAGDFETILVDYAQDAAIMVCHLLQYVIERDVTSIVSIASKARDLVDAKVQFEEKLDPNDPELERKIASSSFMQAELSLIEELMRKVRL